MAGSNERPGIPAPDVAGWLDRYGDDLYRYALFRTGDAELAADLVQDTLLAALDAGDRFSGRSSVKTWLIAILKHKVLDVIRHRIRERTIFAPEPDSDGFVEDRFDERGEWKNSPLEWEADPEKVLSRDEFWKVFRRCLDGMPPRCREAFSLVELDGLKTEEACEAMNLAAANLWVVLHRARMRLRECLETNWFGGEGKG